MEELRDELMRCRAELEEAARLLRRHAPREADAYQRAALRVAKTLDENFLGWRKRAGQ